MFTIGIRLTCLLKATSTRNVRSLSMKPPNVLIYGNKGIEKISQDLKKVFAENTYVIYTINKSQFHSHPWMEHCTLLLCESKKIVEGNSERLLKKFVNEFNGKVLKYGGKEFDKELESIFVKECDSSGVMKYFNKNGILCVLSCNQPLESFSTEELYAMLKKLSLNVKVCNRNDIGVSTQTPGYFISQENVEINNILVADKLSKQIKLLPECDIDYSDIELEDQRFPLFNKVFHNIPQFDVDMYYKYLETNTYGKHFIYTDIIHSTQNLMKSFNPLTFKQNGFFITAKQQSRGIGRSGNQWLSPIGCMMLTLNIWIPVNSNLGQCLPMIQHIAVVAFVKYVKSKKGCENLDLNIKWPNDIYIKKSHKIGGVVVSSSLFQNKFVVNIGLGVNISNEHPTCCLNQLIREFNDQHNTSLNEFSIEELLAGTITQIESTVDLIQAHGISNFKTEYYKHWVHNNAIVTLEQDGNKKARIIGISNHGYLQCCLEDDAKQTVTLQPDGNSFDMMTNMVFIKS